ncbi:hypothetical protein TNCV_3845591 [Trichonephila clavipes]|nr:hypothetical protein TNCV_3845591 [Trichonephila clavipes]
MTHVFPLVGHVRFVQKFKNLYRWRGHREERKNGEKEEGSQQEKSQQDGGERDHVRMSGIMITLVPRREFNRFESQGVVDNQRFDGQRRGG